MSEARYVIRVTFTASRPLSDSELSDIVDAVAVQVEDPFTRDESGNLESASFSTVVQVSANRLGR